MEQNHINAAYVNVFVGGRKMVLYQMLYTVKEAAMQLHLSEEQIWELFHCGKLKGVMPAEESREILIAGKDMEQFIDGLTRL